MPFSPTRRGPNINRSRRGCRASRSRLLQWLVLALEGPTLFPYRSIEEHLELIHEPAAAVVHLVLLGERHVAQLVRNAARPRVVRGDRDRDAAQIAVVEEVAVQRERGIEAIATAPEI